MMQVFADASNQKVYEQLIGLGVDQLVAFIFVLDGGSIALKACQNSDRGRQAQAAIGA